MRAGRWSLVSEQLIQLTCVSHRKRDRAWKWPSKVVRLLLTSRLG